MRKRIRSDLRSSRPLRLEIFEDRCLLSAANLALAPTLLSPSFIALPTVPTPGLTRVVAPTVNLVTVSTSNLAGVAGLTGTNLPNGAGAVGLVSNLKPTLNLVAASAQAVLINSASVAVSIAANLPEAISVASTGSIPFSADVHVSAAENVSVPTLGTAPITAVVDLKLNDAGGPQLHISIGREPPPALRIISTNIGGQLFVGLVHPDSVDLSWGTSSQASQTIALAGDPVRSTASTSEGLAGANNSLLSDNESQSDTINGPARSDATRAMTLNEQLAAFLPWQTISLTGSFDDATGESEAIGASSLDRPALAGQATFQGGASEIDDAFSIPSPRTEGLLADLLPVNLASLEADIQTLLQQMEQLGVELSSLLARMNLSPWLMAIAVAAIAGEIARRRLQRAQGSALVAACEGANLGWFPGLTGSWSGEEA